MPACLQSDDARLAFAAGATTTEGSPGSRGEKTFGLGQLVSASHAKGVVHNFAFAQAMTVGAHYAAVSFLNDAYGSTATTDRNLCVQGITPNSTALLGTSAVIPATSSQHFAITVPATA